MPVIDLGDSKQVGAVRDLSPTGIGVRGIETRRGEVRTLAVEAGNIFPVDNFSVKGVCRWVKRRRSEGIVDAGFEITSISEDSKQQLNKLVKFLSIRE